jgi:UDP-N-acetylglucosamine 1-carboxyvinyltransferase
LASLNITGGIPLYGELTIHGSKNAALPILAASIMANGEQEICQVPQLLDIEVMLDILKALGVKKKVSDKSILLNTEHITSTSIPEDMMGKMRSSIFLMGPLLARYGQVTLSRPGGCAIGERPIDLHLSGLRALGAEIEERQDEIYCSAKQLIGNRIHMRYPSVGATENLMMAAALAQGETTIHNAAREPEILDLQQYLNKMGANIKGSGSERIVIQGVKNLHPVSYRVIPDRIIAGTMLLSAAITRGHIQINNCVPDHISELLQLLAESGVEIKSTHDIIELQAKGNLKSIEPIQTAPYPGFPTDLQSQLMTYLSTVEGVSVITENVFEGRFNHINDLLRMGADIRIDLNNAFIRGVKSLVGCSVEATDLRAGAALVMAGLFAEGQTEVKKIHYIDRGYQRIEQMLSQLGATVKRID